MKTAETIKDEYAVKQGYDSWAHLRNCFCMDGFQMSVRENIVMKLYANQKLDDVLGIINGTDHEITENVLSKPFLVKDIINLKDQI